MNSFNRLYIFEISLLTTGDDITPSLRASFILPADFIVKENHSSKDPFEMFEQCDFSETLNPEFMNQNTYYSNDTSVL